MWSVCMATLRFDTVTVEDRKERKERFCRNIMYVLAGDDGWCANKNGNCNYVKGERVPNLLRVYLSINESLINPFQNQKIHLCDQHVIHLFLDYYRIGRCSCSCLNRNWCHFVQILCTDMLFAWVIIASRRLCDADRKRAAYSRLTLA